MSSFLDGETLFNKNIDKIVYSNNLYYPDKNIFINEINKLLNEKVYPSEELNRVFDSISPESDKEVLNEKVKNYALHYTEKFINKRKSYNKYNNKSCPVRSISLPELSSNYKELGSRII